MKLRKILTPIATVCSMGAVVTPLTVLTSCKSGKNTGANANLTKEYVCEYSPVAKKSYASKDDALKAYMNYLQPATSNSDNFKILCDDARYAYSKAFQTDNFKSVGQLSSYTLNFEDISINQENKTMQVTFVISAQGKYTDLAHGIVFTNGNFSAKLKMDAPFNIEFCQADDTTFVKQNYIKCSLATTTGKFQLTGSCTMADGSTHEAKNTNWTSFNMNDTPITEDQMNGWVTFNLVINGLMCNIKNITAETRYGVLYTNYMSLAEIGQ